MLFVVNMAGTVYMGTEALRVCCLEIYGRYCYYGYRGTASVLFGDTWQVLFVWVQRHCECVVWRYMAVTVGMGTEPLRVCCLEIHDRHTVFN